MSKEYTTVHAFKCPETYEDFECPEAGTHVCLPKIYNTLAYWFEAVSEDEELAAILQEAINRIEEIHE